jgi:hypothetical protein
MLLGHDHGAIRARRIAEGAPRATRLGVAAILSVHQPKLAGATGASQWSTSSLGVIFLLHQSVL